MALELRFEIPGQLKRNVPLNQPVMKIGTLLSNEIVLRAPGVDPIHALVEEIEPGKWVMTDLGSATGVKINAILIDVETEIHAGDSLTVGTVTLMVANTATEERTIANAQANVSTAPPPPLSGHGEGAAAMTIPSPQRPMAQGVGEPTLRVPTEAQQERRSAREEDSERRGAKDILFSPRHARPTGDVLEVVAYWGDTVLDVELFHPTMKGFERVTIGVPGKAHLIAAGKAHFERHELAEVREGGYKVKLMSGMQARLRKGGKVEKVKGSGAFSMGRRDIAHIKYGAVRYFMLFVRPPSLRLPRTGPSDPLFLSLISLAMLIYLFTVPFLYLSTPVDTEDSDKDDSPWTIVQVPNKPKPTPKPDAVKPPEPEKPPVDLAKKKDVEPVQKKPPPPKPKPFEPAKPREVEKIKQPKPVEKPTEVAKATQNLQPPKQPQQAPNDKPQEAKPADRNDLNNLSKAIGQGMPSTGAKSPDFKLAGPQIKDKPQGAAGGVKGSGMNQQGGARKGTQNADFKGVEDANNNKASGVNLSKLGLGAGKLINKTGAGRIPTNFKNSAGGAGGGMGSASKTYGLGGVGTGKSMGLAGAGGSVNNFGSGAGGFLSGQGGTGGAGGAGLGSAFGGGRGGGRGRANVTVPPGDPVVSGGLTQQEIMAVIRANLNQIRHCYEQLLQRSPSAAGKITAAWTIGMDGRVTSASVANSNISDPRMQGCVTGRIQRWAFPRPRGGQAVNVTFPFVFNPL